MPTVRPAAVAGSFYPAKPSVLAADLEDLLSHAAAPKVEGTAPKAVIVPHAGYEYSGPVAASAYARLARMRGIVRRVVLLGPAHRVGFRGLALPGAEALATPLGAVPVDNEAVSLLSDLPLVSTRADVHRAEHSLEVQLPFLQAVLGDFCVVPLAVGDASDREVAEVLERLWGGPETLVVISSDLSHFLDDRAAKAIDGHTARAIVHLDALQSHEQACGATPINGLLLAARRRGLRGEQVDLRTSGDTAGDRRRVVGYGAFAFFEQACGDASHPPPIRDT